MGKEKKGESPNLDFVNVDVFVLLLELFDADFHGVHGGLGVLEALDGEVGLLHVKRLVGQSLPLVLIPNKT